MALANVSLVDTFDTWRTRTNQVIETLNKQTEGSFGTSGTITISNTSAIGLNVTASSIRVKGNTFDSNAMTFVSNSGTLVISGSGRLGTTVFFDVGALSTSLSDSSAANIASAFTVNAVNNIVVQNYEVSNDIYSLTNTVFALTNTAFAKANAGLTKLNVYNEIINSGTYYPMFTNVSTGNTETIIIDTSHLSYIPSSGTLFVTNLNVAANIISSETVTAMNFNSVSDIAYKENITPIVNSLDIIKSMTGVGFTWKNTKQQTYGVIAQEIEKIVPDLVSNINTDKTVNYDGIIAFLIQAIKEISEEIDQLKKNQ
jgi:hypothetical protein